MQEANAAAETIKSNAYQEGLQQGRHDAQEEVSQRFQAVIQSFDQATEQILGLRQEVLRRAEEDIISLGFNLAAKIIGQQIQSRPDIFITILRRAIERSASPDRIVIHVNPDDLQIAQEQQHDLLRNLGHIRQFTIETDPTIERGGCTVQSDLGEIDARIDAQLEELEQGLREQYSASTENNPS
jgi:flagellar assembly protein FliH